MVDIWYKGRYVVATCLLHQMAFSRWLYGGYMVDIWYKGRYVVTTCLLDQMAFSRWPIRAAATDRHSMDEPKYWGRLGE